MKKKAIILITTCIVLAGAYAFRSKMPSGIHGTVSPADAATMIWASGPKDSVSAMPSRGSFSIDVKPGRWRLHVVSAAPYRDTVLDNVLVEDGRYTDVGEIKLRGDVKN